jgi:hypothetical protein
MTTVVPTRATARLAAAMIRTAIREESGAEAAILHLDDLFPDQYAALVGLLLDAASDGAMQTPDSPPRRQPRACDTCKDTTMELVKGKCRRCYEAARRHAAGSKPRIVHRSSPCGSCGEVKRIYAKGACSACYARQRRAAERDGGRAA